MGKYIKYLSIIFIVTLIDFFTKSGLLHFLANKFGDLVYDTNAVCANCKIEGILVPWKYLINHDYTGLTYFFNIVFDWNSGTSFSLFRSIGTSAPYIITFITAFIIGYLCVYLFKIATQYERFPIALIIGGALGNLIDRIHYGAVADFIQWHIGKWTFPAIFNIGDVFITLGVCLYIVYFIINKRKRKIFDK